MVCIRNQISLNTTSGEKNIALYKWTLLLIVKILGNTYLGFLLKIVINTKNVHLSITYTN